MLRSKCFVTNCSDGESAGSASSFNSPLIPILAEFSLGLSARC